MPAVARLRAASSLASDAAVAPSAWMRLDNDLRAALGGEVRGTPSHMARTVRSVGEDDTQCVRSFTNVRPSMMP